jgi:hypothetical protein
MRPSQPPLSRGQSARLLLAQALHKRAAPRTWLPLRTTCDHPLAHRHGTAASPAQATLSRLPGSQSPTLAFAYAGERIRESELTGAKDERQQAWRRRAGDRATRPLFVLSGSHGRAELDARVLDGAAARALAGRCRRGCGWSPKEQRDQAEQEDRTDRAPWLGNGRRRVADMRSGLGRCRLPTTLCPLLLSLSRSTTS